MSLKIDLVDEVELQYERVRRLAVEAEDDESDESLSSRATAMRALTSLLQELSSLQERTKNMQTIHIVEQTIIETAKEFLDEFQVAKLLRDLEERLSKIQ